LRPAFPARISIKSHGPWLTIIPAELSYQYLKGPSVGDPLRLFAQLRFSAELRPRLIFFARLRAQLISTVRLRDQLIFAVIVEAQL
jgi:hypothetical protein